MINTWVTVLSEMHIDSGTFVTKLSNTMDVNFTLSVEGSSTDSNLGTTYNLPPQNSAMIASHSIWGIALCVDKTVKLAARIFPVRDSTCQCTIFSEMRMSKLTK